MMMFVRTESYCLRWSLLASIALLMVSGLLGSAFADSRGSTSQLLQRYPQAMNMAGYVLNAETNMNRRYSQQMEYGLSPVRDSSSQEDLIEIEGPLVPPLPQTKQSPFLLHTPRLSD